MELLQQLIGMALFVKELLPLCLSDLAPYTAIVKTPVDRFWSWAEIDAVKAVLRAFYEARPSITDLCIGERPQLHILPAFPSLLLF
jgi:hypothetical protein